MKKDKKVIIVKNVFHFFSSLNINWGELDTKMITNDNIYNNAVINIT